MDAVLNKVEAELTGFVDDFSHYRSVDTRADTIISLDAQIVDALNTLRQHYRACRRLEELKFESQQLDKTIEQTLVSLADCRKQLESNSEPQDAVASIPIDEVLNYATKITKFTHRQPGAETALPWPTEDAIRRGMIAQLAGDHPTDAPAQPAEEAVTDGEAVQQVNEEEHKPQQQPVRKAPPKKINLDLFDSDDD